MDILTEIQMSKERTIIKVGKSPDFIIINTHDCRGITANYLATFARIPDNISELNTIFGMKVITSHDLKTGNVLCGFNPQV